MAANSLSNLSFLSLYSASLLLLLLPFQPFAASRGPFLAKYDADNATLPLTGICSAAVTINGYKCQEFDVTTDDGYILGLLRIPEGRAGGGGANRPPVLLQHGLLVDGISWLMNPPEESLPLILADNGFDVWISNLRGTQFSRRHLTIDPTNSEFWNWTWDELVIHDLQSVINFVFNQTGNNCCLNASTAEAWVKNAPQATSTKNLVHFSQGYGGQDALSDVEDVRILLDVLKSHDQDKIKVQYVEQYGHVDFIMGVDAKDLVYGEVLEFFRAHN
ncbi:UNVERIFIED_CONTAM: Triacylglycerol lipase 2 [Sesamum angustifolium]|uniref:Triacylglycerol lipase 2 n=1 Tax=Sesamum angustifolium TaxID=2727405 RepID=A0AAW2NNR9_9LAMI